VIQNHWKRLNTLQHYKVPDARQQGRVNVEQGLCRGSASERPRLCSPISSQVPDGATVGLIPQLNNGGVVSQSVAQSCPSGESESLGPATSGCRED
jgi:plexin B